MIQLVLNKLGAITATPNQKSEFQCVAQGIGLYYYEVRIAFINPKLDPRGWTIDHIEVDRIMQDYYKSREIPSCEEFAIGAAQLLARVVQGYDMPASSVYVRISNIPSGSQGFFEATWFPDKQS